VADKIINARIRHRVSTALEWTAVNPVLLRGEIGIESDTRFAKIGDGSTAWKALNYLTAPASATDSNLVASCYDEATETWEDIGVTNITISATGDDLTISQITDFPFDVLERNKAYKVNTPLFSGLLPKGYYMVCTTAGTTAETAPDYSVPVAWSNITDGTCIFTICQLLTKEPVMVSDGIITDADVDNAAGKIPRYSSDGHLIIPSGLELW
jgi:hypothetical protein